MWLTLVNLDCWKSKLKTDSHRLFKMHPYFFSFLFLAIGTPFVKALPTTSDLKGLDVAFPQPAGFWTCVYNNGFTKIAIRGFKVSLLFQS
jgi:hypothetical protein